MPTRYASPLYVAQTRGGISIGHHLLSSFPRLGAPTPCRGPYTAGRTSPRSGPEGRTLDAAPVTILHSDGPGLQGVESGIFTYGVHAKRKDAHEAAYKRSGFTHAAVGTDQGQGGEFDSPVWQLGPLRALEKAGKLPIERWRNR